MTSKVSHGSQLEKAILGLRTLVLSGEVDAGERLSEVAVAKTLGLSRTPLRQAMDRLVAEGLLERIATGGCKVARITEDDIADAIELRGVLEGTAARLAAERGPDPDLLSQARDALDQIDTAIDCFGMLDFDLYIAENSNFHRLLARLSGSALMERELERINRLPLASPSAFLNEHKRFPDFVASLNRAQFQHRAILNAIGNREGARAEALAREHARLARENFDLFKAGHQNGTVLLSSLGLAISK